MIQYLYKSVPSMIANRAIANFCQAPVRNFSHYSADKIEVILRHEGLIDHDEYYWKFDESNEMLLFKKQPQIDSPPDLGPEVVFGSYEATKRFYPGRLPEADPKPPKKLIAKIISIVTGKKDV